MPHSQRGFHPWPNVEPCDSFVVTALTALTLLRWAVIARSHVEECSSKLSFEAVVWLKALGAGAKIILLPADTLSEFGPSCGGELGVGHFAQGPV